METDNVYKNTGNDNLSRAVSKADNVTKLPTYHKITAKYKTRMVTLIKQQKSVASSPIHVLKTYIVQDNARSVTNAQIYASAATH